MKLVGCIFLLSVAHISNWPAASGLLSGVVLQKQNKQLDIFIDSIAGNLSNRCQSCIFYTSIDFQEQIAYSCILKQDGSNVKGTKLKITEKQISSIPIRNQFLAKGKDLIQDFFRNSNQYLSEQFDDGSKIEISHDNRMFFFAKVNGRIVYKGYFYRSHYLKSGNQKIKHLFLKLDSLAD